MKKVVLFWSAGKDSAMALHKIQNDENFELLALVTTLNEEYKRVSMHGIPEVILDRQCEALGIPLIKMWVPNQAANDSYEHAFLELCGDLKKKGVEVLAFGDIHLEDLRKYREELVNRGGLKASFPLWEIPTVELMNNFIANGFKAITCCINTGVLSEDWIGRQLDRKFLEDLPEGVDPCGENGEYHTFCFAGPVFKDSIPYQTGELVFKPLKIETAKGESESGFLFLDII
ncbi:MJ0570-related uncharacterized domain-containing protein [Daejeonella rubra]|uniref:MJ0570-related uncharacterized domain-containing protein n=1 Tax=Daejeonella rubra TaxID=990371 RepID=A0A1G9UD62_9SPHI|nr:diphthine--ammonia ligase [Daejeonella rubra]SDM57891.1 MJ0570-related uncharacterized domain-containing protein [Daejeonella rubra]